MVFAKDDHLTLRIVLTLDCSIRTFQVFVLDVLASRHLLVALLALQQDELTVVLEMVFHPHPDHFFDAELADFNPIQAVLSMTRHHLPRNPSFTARVQTHDKFVSTGFLVLSKRSIADLRSTAVPIVHALQVE